MIFLLQCSSSCGEGEKTREVFCGTIDNGNSSHIVRVSPDLCDADKKILEKETCTENFTCDGQWFTGPWMGVSICFIPISVEIDPAV